MKLCKEALLLASATLVSARVCDVDAPLSVEALVFSGTPNPQVTLSEEKRQALCDIVTSGNSAVKVPTCRVLGFTGWQACAGDDCDVFRGHSDIDELLMPAFDFETDDVMQHVKEESQRLSSGDGDVHCPEEEPQEVPDSDCTGPIRGSDDAHDIHYDVQNDVNGCFVTKQSDNNCYNYGNDVLTNTFAQPGRGTGVCPPNTRPCVENTCEAVKNAAIHDGLQWVGTELPTSLPEKGHYVSLHIWPNSNFHWLRMDANMKWSHKPGGSPVRNYDNNHDEIVDPSKADVSPWSQHCGYLLSIPSGATIKATAPSLVVA